MLSRRLALAKETLTALTPADMAGVSGGTADPSVAGVVSCVTCIDRCTVGPVFPPSLRWPTYCV